MSFLLCLCLCLCLSVLISEVSSTPPNPSSSVSEDSCLKRDDSSFRDMRCCHVVLLNLEKYDIIHNLNSSALYLSIYLPKAQLKNPQHMVRHRILKAIRAAPQNATSLTPTAVILYARVNFTNTPDFLIEIYLEIVLEEIAALGVDGVMLWGKSKYQCLLLKYYMEKVLRDYELQLHRGVQRCSQVLCGGHGRCKRQQPHSGFMIPLGEDMPDVALLRKTFQCVCERGWSGKACEKRDKSDTH